MYPKKQAPFIKYCFNYGFWSRYSYEFWF